MKRVLVAATGIMLFASFPVWSQSTGCRNLGECIEQVAQAVRTANEAITNLVGEVRKAEVPVGTIVASPLSPDRFLSSENPQISVSKWVVADGRALPANSVYQRLSGQANAPDLRFMTGSLVVSDIVVRDVAHGTDVNTLRSNAHVGADWRWHVGLRDIQGNRAGRQYENDIDNFQVYLSGTTVIAQGRTQSYLYEAFPHLNHGWGSWRGGAANVLGFAVRPSPLHHYLKIN